MNKDDGQVAAESFDNTIRRFFASSKSIASLIKFCIETKQKSIPDRRFSIIASRNFAPYRAVEWWPEYC
jgi:negative regulator of replication initiation